MNDTLHLIFVLYKPDCSFYSRLLLADQLGFHIVVFCNCEESITALRSLALSGRCEVIGTGVNIGLSRAYNLALRRVRDKNFEYALIFDQDTDFRRPLFERLGVVLRYCAPNTGFLQLCDGGDSGGSSGFYRVERRNFIINSGSIVRTSVWEQVGGFCEEFFVDFVDYEYCLRLRYRGFEVARLNGPFGIDHRSFQDDKVRSIFGMKVVVRRYPRSRIYEVFYGFRRLFSYSLVRGDFASCLLLTKFFLGLIKKHALSFF